MNKTIAIAGSLALVLTIGSAVAQSNEDIVGKWNIKKYTTNQPVKAQVIEHRKKVALSTTYTFREDGTFAKSSLDESLGNEGFWELIENTKRLNIYYSEDKSDASYNFPKTIDSFKKKKMVWSDLTEGLGYEYYTLEKTE